MHKAEALRRGLTLEVIESPSGTPPTVLGDRGKIRQIITNVVANAVKHTSQGGILVEWGELADADVGDASEHRSDSIRIALSITDTGTGISDARLESIFREFEQVSTVGDDQQGTPERSTLGLGLAVVARIVRNLGGQLRVESKLESGSKFTFVLPFRLPSNNPSSNRAITCDDWISANAENLITKKSSMGRSGSTGSIKSLGSNSSARSEIDSLISAMSTSHMDVGSMSAAITAKRRAARRAERADRKVRQVKSSSSNNRSSPLVVEKDLNTTSSTSRKVSIDNTTSPLSSMNSLPSTPALYNESLPTTSSHSSPLLTPLPTSTNSNPLTSYNFPTTGDLIKPRDLNAINSISPIATPRASTPVTSNVDNNQDTPIIAPKHVSEYKSAPKSKTVEKELPLPSMRVLVVEVSFSDSFSYLFFSTNFFLIIFFFLSLFF